MSLLTTHVGDDGVLTVTLTRPEAKNALNLEMVRAFRAALAASPRALVLKSGVPGVFSIGMDLAALDASCEGGRALDLSLIGGEEADEQEG